MTITMYTVQARAVDEHDQLHMAAFTISEVVIEHANALEYVLLNVVQLLTEQVCRSSGCEPRQLGRWEVHQRTY